MRNFIFLFFIFLILLTACAPKELPQATPVPTPDEIGFCTADVQGCPDGSFVSRIAPDCAFAPCPQ